MGYAYYTKRGYKILVQLVDNCVFDFVIYKSGKYKSINVKKGSKHQGRWGFSVGKCQRHADVFLVWINPQGRFVEVKKEQLSFKSRRIAIPAKLLINESS